MVLAYNCETCGFQDDCDVSKSGERLCPECGMAVTGITSQDINDHPKETPVEFVVGVGYGPTRGIRVTAHGYEDAFETAQSELRDDEHITEISLARNVRRV